MSTTIIYTGDVLRHTSSRRVGVVLEVGRTHRDGSTEYRVRLVSHPDRGLAEIWWNSLRVERVERRDPYRRYLALCAVEDTHVKQARRASHPRPRVRRNGGWLPEQVWETMYWCLSNRRRLLPSGEPVHYPLGRDHWDRAAVDCLERRDRAGHFWMTRGPVPPGVRAREGEG